MHKDQLSFVTVTPFTDFFITSSVDGVVKFWKKMGEGIEFVKEFRAHPGEIHSANASADGRSFATAGADKTVKIFDVITFGMCHLWSVMRYEEANRRQIYWPCIRWTLFPGVSAGCIAEGRHCRYSR